jgi:hypothetical protein
MSRSLKHYWNDQFTRMLRNFPYPIRRKIKEFPPMSAAGQQSVVAVLCGPNQFLEGLWSLWSWMRHMNSFMGAVLLFDGKATGEQQELFGKLFPDGQLLNLEEFLKARSLPDYLQRFVAGNWTAKKLAAVFELQKEYNVLYSDSDVLVFQKPDEIIAAIERGHSAYLFDQFGYTVDPWLATRAKQLEIPVTNQFNAGLVFVPKGEMKGPLLEAILSDWQPSFNSHHAEQTLFSILLNPREVRPLPQERYVLSWQGVWIFEKDLDCRQIVSRHYIGPLRHRMYLTAYPFIFKQIRSHPPH